MTSSNGLVCFTNCLLPQEDGNLVEQDLWIDERRGVIVDAQVTLSPSARIRACADAAVFCSELSSCAKRDRTKSSILMETS